jgi:hypothetical protein
MFSPRKQSTKTSKRRNKARKAHEDDDDDEEEEERKKDKGRVAGRGETQGKGVFVLE